MNNLLVTGANRGIGLELVKQYAKAGWYVLACCRTPEKADGLQDIKKNYPNVDIFKLDVSEPSDINHLASQLKDKPIDILFNNAGVWGPSNQHFGFADSTAWIEVFKINAIAPQLLAEALINNIENSRLKTIVNMVSTLASITENTSGDLYIYRSTKAALSAITKSMATDLKDKKITVIALHPGWVKTDMGGQNAPLTVEESVSAMKTVLSQLSLKDSGTFVGYDGKSSAW